MATIRARRPRAGRSWRRRPHSLSSVSEGEPVRVLPVESSCWAMAVAGEAAEQVALSAGNAATLSLNAVAPISSAHAWRRRVPGEGAAPQVLRRTLAHTAWASRGAAEGGLERPRWRRSGWQLHGGALGFPLGAEAVEQAALAHADRGARCPISNRPSSPSTVASDAAARKMALRVRSPSARGRRRARFSWRRSGSSSLQQSTTGRRVSPSNDLSCQPTASTRQAGWRSGTGGEGSSHGGGKAVISRAPAWRGTRRR